MAPHAHDSLDPAQNDGPASFRRAEASKRFQLTRPASIMIEIKAWYVFAGISLPAGSKSAKLAIDQGGAEPMSRLPGGVFVLAALMGFSLPASADDVALGKALVELNCARCHAVDRTSDSGHADAPPFRTLSHRYPLDSLEEALAEGISTGHPDMPEFTATPEQISAILAYIGSLN